MDFFVVGVEFCGCGVCYVGYGVKDECDGVSWGR